MSTTPAMNRLLDNVRIKAPGVVDSVIFMEAFNTIKEFSQKTNVWQEIVPINVVAGQREYYITTTAGLPNELLWIALPGDMTPDGTDPPSSISGNTHGLQGTMPSEGCILLRYAPNMDAVYNVCVGLRVSDPLTKDQLPIFPDNLIDKWQKALTYGILSNLYLQPNKPYTSLQGAQVAGGFFRQGCSQAIASVRHQNTYAAQTWRFPGTFNNRRSQRY